MSPLCEYRTEVYSDSGVRAVCVCLCKVCLWTSNGEIEEVR